MAAIIELGIKDEKVLIFGGSYSNVQALEKLREIAKDIPKENIIFAGDSVAYCAEPEETAKILRNWGINSIAGNVEMQLREDRDDCACNFKEDSTCEALSKQWYPYCKEHISKESLEWMETLPDFLRFQMNNKEIMIVHGSYSNTSQFIFKSTEWQVKEQELEKAEADIIIGGHAGIPFSHKENDKAWINAGVVGMPANDGTPRVWYLTLTPDKEGIKVEHKSFEYNNEKASKLMEKNNLPKEYSKTLKTGIWDNCDILPEQEIKEQGKRLEFDSFIIK
ncbi:metallophosphoesterase family protein [Candidatus Woesearchaeota archaeon]|nr:metallophosphoesterase family protein [Candidatus Woesearchaeota archaeon]